ncbi:hypothetical protein BVX98_04570 [bacterium F11]|nr:hypothetical protein BVX98_04570 [bacterium F11]
MVKLVKIGKNQLAIFLPSENDAWGKWGAYREEGCLMGIRDTLARLNNHQSDVSHNYRGRLKVLFKEAMNRISENWQDGTYEQLQIINPALDKKIQMAENDLNEVWRLSLAGQKPIEDFKCALQAWESLHYDAIDTVGEFNGH